MLQQILSLLRQLITWKNDLIANSKTNEELPVMNPINRNSLVRASLLGVSKSFTLQSFIDDISTEFIRGNVPAKFRNIIIDQTTTTPSDIVKMRNGINALPNYVLQEGAMYFFTNQRLVLTNGTYGFPRPGGYYAIVTEYYALTKNIEPVNGISSVGVDGTPITTSDLKYLFTIDNRSYEPVEFQLGDIGANNIWSRVDVDPSGPFSTPNGTVVIFTATQNGNEESWLYMGNEETIGVTTGVVTTTVDFKLFTDSDNPPTYQETLPSSYNVSRVNAPLDNHEGYFADMTSASLLNQFTTGNHKVGGYSRFLISTTGKTQFPTVVSTVVSDIVTLIDSPSFEADELYDLFIECVYVDRTLANADIILYFFRKR